MAYYPSQQEEHQQVLDWLDQVRQGVPDIEPALGNILRAFQSGWLAPGPYVLKLLETRPEEFRKEILSRPSGLQKKWFHEMDSEDQLRWLDVLESVLPWERVQSLLLDLDFEGGENSKPAAQEGNRTFSNYADHDVAGVGRSKSGRGAVIYAFGGDFVNRARCIPPDDVL